RLSTQIHRRLGAGAGVDVTPSPSPIPSILLSRFRCSSDESFAATGPAPRRSQRLQPSLAKACLSWTPPQCVRWILEIETRTMRPRGVVF
ncbi:unnamed protein product, partial [Ixodes persulcatus]